MMRILMILMLAIVTWAAIPAVSEAACGRGFVGLGWHPFQNMAERRRNGEGVGQSNGPLRRRNGQQVQYPKQQVSVRSCR